MATRIIHTRLQLRSDTAANWLASNPILLLGEAGYEKDTRKLKIGDGSTSWNSLSYFATSSGGSSISSGSYTVEKLATPETGYFATYVLKDDGGVIQGAKINIPNASVDLSNYSTLADLQIGEAITVSQNVGNITAGTSYTATTKMSKILKDLLSSTSSTPVNGHLYYGVGSTVPTSVAGLTSVGITVDTLLTTGYIYKNINLSNEYVFLAIDKSLGLECYEILQSGFALGMATKDFGNQILYYPDGKATDTGVRLVYHFEEV